MLPHARAPLQSARRARPRRVPARGPGCHRRAERLGWARSSPIPSPTARGKPMTKPHDGPPTRPTLAYRDTEFLDSDEARPLRILAEYLEPLHAFRRQRIHDTIVFFGSARLAADGPLGRYYAEARELARL